MHFRLGVNSITTLAKRTSLRGQVSTKGGNKHSARILRWAEALGLLYAERATACNPVMNKLAHF